MKRKKMPAKYKFILLLICTGLFSFPSFAQDDAKFNEYSGKVVDATTGNGLVFASLAIEGTNISVITNGDGEFLLKAPMDIGEKMVTVSFLGYQPKQVELSSLKKKNNKISLNPSSIELSEVSLNLPKDARTLVESVFKQRSTNNLDKHTIMTAFYRETVKKGRKNASLAEAIVNIYKEPYMSPKSDRVALYKSRKSTDYTKLDTLALKLQGGPFNALFLDLMKYPEYVFTETSMKWYQFSFAPSTTVNDKPVYVVNFKQLRGITEPLFYGKLYIDSETKALTSAIYSLNLSEDVKTDNLFVKKKPKGVQVYATKASYRVDYRVKDGKWYYGYSNVQLAFKINKKKSWFNKKYSLMSEMAITDWSYNTNKEKIATKDRLKSTIIISDETSGFSDPEFWGAYNVIEPEKSIESAINKIKRQLKKANKS